MSHKYLKLECPKESCVYYYQFHLSHSFRLLISGVSLFLKKQSTQFIKPEIEDPCSIISHIYTQQPEWLVKNIDHVTLTFKIFNIVHGHPPSVLNISTDMCFAFCLPLVYQFLKQVLILEDFAIFQVYYLGKCVWQTNCNVM